MAQIPTDERRFKAPKVTPTVSVVRPTGTAPQGKLGSPSAVGFNPAYTPTPKVTQNTKGFSSNPVTNPGSVKPAANLFEYAFQPTYDKYVAPYMPSSNTLSQNNASYLNYINPQYTAPAGKKYDWLTDAVDTASAFMSGKDSLRGIAPVPSYAVDINSMPSANAGDYSQWKTDPRVTQNLYPPFKPGKQEITPYGYNNMGDTYTEQDGTTRFVPWQYKVWKSVIDKEKPLPDWMTRSKDEPTQVPEWAEPIPLTSLEKEGINSIIDDPNLLVDQKIAEIIAKYFPRSKPKVVNPLYQGLKKIDLFDDLLNPNSRRRYEQHYNQLEAMTERMRLNQKRYGAFASPEDLQRNIVPFGYKTYPSIDDTNPVELVGWGQQKGFVDEPINKPVAPYSRPDKNNQVLFPGDKLLDSQKFSNPKMLNSIIQQLKDIGLNKLAEDILNQNTQQLRIAYPGYLQSNDEHPNFNNQLRPIKPNQPYPNQINPFKFSSGD